MNRKKYNHLSAAECILLRQRYNELLRAYVPRYDAMFRILSEFNIGEGTFWRIMKRK